MDSQTRNATSGYGARGEVPRPEYDMLHRPPSSLRVTLCPRRLETLHQSTDSHTRNATSGYGARGEIPRPPDDPDPLRSADRVPPRRRLLALAAFVLTNK